jgi:hypothetical protein
LYRPAAKDLGLIERYRRSNSFRRGKLLTVWHFDAADKPCHLDIFLQQEMSPRSTNGWGIERV